MLPFSKTSISHCTYTYIIDVLFKSEQNKKKSKTIQQYRIIYFQQNDRKAWQAKGALIQ